MSDSERYPYSFILPSVKQTSKLKVLCDMNYILPLAMIQISFLIVCFLYIVLSDKMSASPMARATTVGQDIPRRVVINNEDDMPDDYSTTPG